MIFIIPMAGRGSRFEQAGYAIPKYMIEVKGKTLFEYSMESLPLDICENIIFICLEEHKKYDVENFINSKVKHKNIQIVYLKDITKGQAQTVYSVKNLIKDDDEILIYNIDTNFKSGTLKDMLLDKDLKRDGILGAFIDKSNDDKWSFAQVNKDNIITRTTEKEKISDYALTGLYHFTKAKDFFDIAKHWINNDKTIKNEFYIAPMYNDLISKNKKFTLDIVDEFTPLGTPKEVEDFENKQ